MVVVDFVTGSLRLGDRHVLAALGGVLCALAGCGIASAQVPALPGAVQPGRDRPALSAPAQPEFEFRIETPSRSSVPRAVDEIRFRLNDIVVKGAVTLSPARFRPFYQKLIGRDVALSDILDVAEVIENEYRHNGYVLVRAFVPPQRVADGVFVINVVEGFIANVAVEGGNEGTRDRIRALLQPTRTARPLKLETIEQALLLANDLPGVTASGLLRPSAATPGASDLVVSVPPGGMSGGLAIDNRGSRFSGIWSATADMAVNAVLDDTDQLDGSITAALASSPLRRAAAQLRYRLPVGSHGGLMSLIGTLTHGEPGSTLTAFNVLTDSWAAGPRFSFPLKRSRAESIVIEGGFTAQEARVKILGAPLSHDRWRVADIGVSYARSDLLGAAWAANIDFAHGIPALGASDNGDPNLSRPGARVDFAKISGGLRVTRRLFGPVSLALAAQGQYAFDPLLIGEKFAFGGAGIGRGYDMGALTGDHGAGGTLELRYDRSVNAFAIQAVQPYVFLDAARVWDVRGPPGQSIQSAGGGVRVWLDHDIFSDVEVAQTMTAVPGSDGGRRATKVLLNLGARF
jgi:hemolysin activation/secretion protein